MTRIVECVGGRAAEEIVFNSITTGAANDIEQATKMARAMITQYGMSEKFGMVGLESPENQYLSGRNVLNIKPYMVTKLIGHVQKRCSSVRLQETEELLIVSLK